MLLRKILSFQFFLVNCLQFLFIGFSLSETLTLTKDCYTVHFEQENYFEGEADFYKGVLIRKGQRVEIYYYTKPIFFIKADKRYIKLGYKGGDTEIYDRKDYKNPILEVLLNLNRLGDYFETIKVENGTLILKPEGELKNCIDTVKVLIDKRGIPKEIEVVNDPQNFARIYINSLEDVCNFKIKDP